MNGLDEDDNDKIKLGDLKDLPNEELKMIVKLTNKEKLEILVNMPQVAAALQIMVAAFKEMELKSYFILPCVFENTGTGEDERYDIMFQKKEIKQSE